MDAGFLARALLGPEILISITIQLFRTKEFQCYEKFMVKL